MVGSTFQYDENNQRLHHSTDLAGEYTLLRLTSILGYTYNPEGNMKFLITM